MLAVNTFAAPRAGGPEPAVALAGTAVLGTAAVLPAFWSRGLNPVPPCLFHLMTGQPCPFCGGTRSFVAMARGDLAGAAHVFPVGPLLFVGVIVAVLYSLAAVVTGTRVRLVMDQRLRRVITAVAVLLLAANWAAKLLVLGY